MTSLLNIAGNIPVVAEAGGQSLRFEDGDSAYLSWTPASAGNRKTWTWSGWVKRGNLGTTQTLFITQTLSPNSYQYLLLNTSNQLEHRFVSSGTEYHKTTTNAVYRDSSAWYHVVLQFDSTQSTASDRDKIYINGERQTLVTTTQISQNVDGLINYNIEHRIGESVGTGVLFDGYLANVCFIDGQALDPTSFGEYDGTLWRPKSDADIQSLTFGTNGFYLPFKQTTEAEGFSTVTYTGNGGAHSIEGVGFEPDLVWVKDRTTGSSHRLHDSIRGAGIKLSSDTTGAEVDESSSFTSFDANGFSLAGSAGAYNTSGRNYVAWCWDAGSGSAVSNTDGSITSQVKANTAKGFSIVTGTTPSSYTSYSFGHGLTSAPEFVIWKERGGTSNWNSWHTGLSSSQNMIQLNTSTAEQSAAYYGTIDSSVVTQTGSTFTNLNSDFVAYCFHSVSGYSSIGSYSGTGASGNSVTTGFEPAWIMIKRTDSGNNWVILDTTRDVDGELTKYLSSDSSSAESDSTQVQTQIDATGFTLESGFDIVNASGGTYIYMAFADTRDATFFGDTSGNGNNWTPNKLNNTDVVLDSPVTGGNFAVLNTVDKYSSAAISEGNLEIGTNTNAWYHQARATMFVNSGKWYWEVCQANTGGFWKIGIRDNDAALTSNTTSSTGFEYYASNGNKHSSSGASAYSSETYANGVGTVYAFALDMDAGTITLYVNGVSQGTMFSGLSGYYAPTCSMYNSTIIFNFGQDSSFAGTKTPQGNGADDEDFYYTPPSGFVSLKTSNLPTPSITAPDEYFNTLLYTGTGSSLSVTGANFQPDWTWIKKRSAAENHALYDVVRGTTNRLQSNVTTAENTGGLTSFDSDGFTVDGAYGTDGENGATYVAWNWLAGGTAVSNTDGSITSQVSANTDAGFSVVGYTGNGNASETVGHGLSVTPEMVIIKKRSTTSSWYVAHYGLNNSYNYAYHLFLDSTAAVSGSNDPYFMGSGNTSSVINVLNYSGSNGGNENGTDYIAYCFHSVEGYSKIGSYTGNGSTDGTFVHCGFSPSYVMWKRTDSTGSWYILDNKRNGFNPDNRELSPESSAAEADYDRLDFVSNGFKHRQSYVSSNGSGATYIFIAFAEAPFKSANAR